MSKKSGKPQRPESGPCHFCKTPLTGEDYCHGCNVFICDNCDTSRSPWGPHNPEDHQRQTHEDDNQ